MILPLDDIPGGVEIGCKILAENYRRRMMWALCEAGITRMAGISGMG